MKAPKPQYLLYVRAKHNRYVLYFESFAKADLFANEFLSKKSIYWHIRNMETDKMVVRYTYGFYESLTEQEQ